MVSGRARVSFRHRRHPRRAATGAGGRGRTGRAPRRRRATIRQYLQAGLVDEMHLAISTFPLDRGESLFAGIDLLKLGYQCAEHVSIPAALHMVLRK